MHLSINTEYTNIKMLCIDPGLSTCGVAIYRLDTNSKKIESIEAFTIDVEALNNIIGYNEELIPVRFIKIMKLCNFIKRLIEIENIKIVVCEAPFYNRFMPMAYGALLEVVSNIQRSVYEVDCNILFTAYAPQLVKKSIGAAGKKGKEIIKEKVSMSYLRDKILGDFNLLDEHSIDAIAVGNAFLIQRNGYEVWT